YLGVGHAPLLIPDPDSMRTGAQVLKAGKGAQGQAAQPIAVGGFPPLRVEDFNNSRAGIMAMYIGDLGLKIQDQGIDEPNGGVFWAMMAVANMQGIEAGSQVDEPGYGSVGSAAQGIG